MYLHEQKEEFKEIIEKASNEYIIDASIIEKDYYVSAILKAISMASDEFVFKGGTSLSKCYGVINRFSEDIDLSVLKNPSRNQRRQYKEIILDAAKSIGLRHLNPSEIKSGRDFNQYRFSYQSIFEHTIISNTIVLELYFAIIPFPVDYQDVNSYIGKLLSQYRLDKLLKDYQLSPFSMHVQDIARTLLDKIFAICDYYIKENDERNSRHIYDIHQILQKIHINEIDASLIMSVRHARQENIHYCPSADKDISLLLKEIIEKQFFRKDYMDITEKLLFQYVPYDDSIGSLQAIVDSDLF